MEIKPFKIRNLTQIQGKIIQETLFKSGYNWYFGHTNVRELITELSFYGKTSNPYEGIPNLAIEFTDLPIPEITYQQFCDMYVKEEEFVLPKKWYIKQEYPMLRTFCNYVINKKPEWNNSWTPENIKCNPFITNESYPLCSSYTPFGEEITFDQFKKFVLKEGQEGLCTNPSTHRGSCNEKEGCIQDCDNCDFYNLNQKEMSKEELLREAKRRYPKGSLIKGLMYDKVYRIENSSKFTYYKTNKEYITDGCGDSVYLDGKWTEIVQDTLKVENLVEGEIYVDGNGVLFKYTDIQGSQNPYIKKDSFGKSGATVGLGLPSPYTLAQFSDRQWLEACISANKFISKEEALKSKNTFKKDDYIVLLYGNLDSFKKDYIFKQREDSRYLQPWCDCNGSISNGWGSIEYKGKKDWRYATKEEIAEYDRLGKPFDVTTLKSKDEWWQTLKKGDIIKCIKNTSGSPEKEIGQEYVLPKDSTRSYITYSLGLSAIHSDFELVRKVHEVEKWGVGTYVVFLKDDIQSNKKLKGNIEKIVELRFIAEGKCYVFEYYDGYCNDTQYTDKYPNDIKWFATLQEAEEFSRSLKHPIVIEENELLNIPDRVYNRIETVTIKPELEALIQIRTINKIKI